tara:strand:+ start:78 stop:212 length:135 start_codon:yes stop_codon:yes gene_type:complete
MIILEFLGLMGIAIIATLVIVVGFWFGFKVVDLATGGELTRILN